MVLPPSSEEVGVRVSDPGNSFVTHVLHSAVEQRWLPEYCSHISRVRGDEAGLNISTGKFKKYYWTLNHFKYFGYDFKNIHIHIANLQAQKTKEIKAFILFPPIIGHPVFPTLEATARFMKSLYLPDVSHGFVSSVWIIDLLQLNWISLSQQLNIQLDWNKDYHQKT